MFGLSTLKPFSQQGILRREFFPIILALVLPGCSTEKIQQAPAKKLALANELLSFDALKNLTDSKFDVLIKTTISKLASESKFFAKVNQALQEKGFSFVKADSNQFKQKPGYKFNAITICNPDTRLVALDLENIKFVAQQVSVGKLHQINLNYSENLMAVLINEAVHIIEEDPDKQIDPQTSFEDYCLGKFFEENLSFLPHLIFAYNKGDNWATRLKQDNILSNVELNLERILYFIFREDLFHAVNIVNEQILANMPANPGATQEEIKEAKKLMLDDLVRLIVSECLNLQYIHRLEDKLIELGAINQKAGITEQDVELAKRLVLRRFPKALSLIEN